MEFEEAGKEISAVGLYFSLLAFLEACGCELSSSDGGVGEDRGKRGGNRRREERGEGGKGQREDEEGGEIKVKVDEKTAIFV